MNSNRKLSRRVLLVDAENLGGESYRVARNHKVFAPEHGNIIVIGEGGGVVDIICGRPCGGAS